VQVKVTYSMARRRTEPRHFELLFSLCWISTYLGSNVPWPGVGERNFG
jgi:hypothetical protein